MRPSRPAVRIQAFQASRASRTSARSSLFHSICRNSLAAARSRSSASARSDASSSRPGGTITFSAATVRPFTSRNGTAMACTPSSCSSLAMQKSCAAACASSALKLRNSVVVRGVPRAGFVYIGAARLQAGLPRAQRHQVMATWPARRATLAPMPSIAALPHYNYDALDHVGQSLVYRLKPIKHNPATKSSARHLLKQERARNIQPMQYGQCKPKDQ